MKKLILISTLVSSSFLFNQQALATQLIVPSMYTATLGEGIAASGDFDYFDESLNQLTDGIIGDNDWTKDLGNGNAHEWVGWLTIDPTIDFTFSSLVSISQISIGFSHSEAAGIYLPKSVEINGKLFKLKGTEIANGKRGFINFDIQYSGTNVNIGLADNDSNRWIFVDEIKFTTPVIQGAAPWQIAHTVTCQNISQNKTIVIPKTKLSNWNCEKSGLIFKSGDKIKVTIEGTKY